MLDLHKIYHLKLKLFFCTLALFDMTFSLLTIYRISETRTVSYDAVLCILHESSDKPYFASFEIQFCEDFQQHLDVYQYLKNLSFICLRASEFIVCFLIIKYLVDGIWAYWPKINMTPVQSRVNFITIRLNQQTHFIGDCLTWCFISEGTDETLQMK